MVLLVLAVVWTVYLFTWVRSRRDRRGVNSISTFSHHLSVLERTSPARPSGVLSISSRPQGRLAPIYPAVGYRPPRASMSLTEARRRRRNVLVGLAAAALLTMVLLPFLGSFVVVLHLLIDALLVTYVVLLLHNQRLAVERREKVRYLPHVGATEPAYLLARSAT